LLGGLLSGLFADLLGRLLGGLLGDLLFSGFLGGLLASLLRRLLFHGLFLGRGGRLLGSFFTHLLGGFLFSGFFAALFRDLLFRLGRFVSFEHQWIPPSKGNGTWTVQPWIARVNGNLLSLPFNYPKVRDDCTKVSDRDAQLYVRDRYPRNYRHGGPRWNHPEHDRDPHSSPSLRYSCSLWLIGWTREPASSFSHPKTKGRRCSASNGQLRSPPRGRPVPGSFLSPRASPSTRSRPVSAVRCEKHWKAPPSAGNPARSSRSTVRSTGT